MVAVAEDERGACPGSQSDLMEWQVFAGVGCDNDVEASAGVGGRAMESRQRVVPGRL